MKISRVALRWTVAVIAVPTIVIGIRAAPVPAGVSGSTLAGAVSPASASAAAPTTADSSAYLFKLLAKAKPDECFNGIGLPYPVGPPCATGKPKVNQAYVWGLTQVGKMIWFGTGANVHCLVSGATLAYVKPMVNSDYTCEFGESQLAKSNPAIPPYIGDLRPPEVWTYDTKTKTSVNLTAQIRAKSPADAARLRSTVGMRAAGTFGNVVLFGGPALGSSLNMFAFNATTKAYLGSTTMAEYGNIRTFLVAYNALYLGVGIGRNGTAGGGVLRWVGDATNPFAFVNVANLPVQAADLVFFNGRITATSWPAAQAIGTQGLAGLWISPKISDGAPGLNAEDANGWKQVWNVSQYEPDKLVAGTYGGGGIAAFDGYVYWGTMHVPMKATAVASSTYPPADKKAAVTQAINTQRAISIWRGKDLGTAKQKIELLYGESALPAYDPATGTWSSKSTHYTPLYGHSGFGNPFNNYTWRMTVVDHHLFVGTMDWSYLVKDLIQAAQSGASSPSPADQALADPASWQAAAVSAAGFGGDLYMFGSDKLHAVPINTHGQGNYLNYGVRNMIPAGHEGLYLGMANPMNLRTDLTDTTPEGGWELIEMTSKH